MLGWHTKSGWRHINLADASNSLITKASFLKGYCFTLSCISIHSTDYTVLFQHAKMWNSQVGWNILGVDKFHSQRVEMNSNTFSFCIWKKMSVLRIWSSKRMRQMRSSGVIPSLCGCHSSLNWGTTIWCPWNTTLGLWFMTEDSWLKDGSSGFCSSCPSGLCCRNGSNPQLTFVMLQIII